MIKQILFAGTLGLAASQAASAPLTFYFKAEHDFSNGNPESLLGITLPDEITGSFTVDTAEVPYFSAMLTSQNVARRSFLDFTVDFVTATYAVTNQTGLGGMAVFDALATPFDDKVTSQIDQNVTVGSGVIDQVNLFMDATNITTFSSTAVPTVAQMQTLVSANAAFLDFRVLDSGGSMSTNDTFRYSGIQVAATAFSATPVPLPASGLLIIAGMAGLSALRRSKARASGQG